MLKSIYQNEGFYIGKYEAGIEDSPRTSGSADKAPTETPVIKQNAYPYNYVTCSQAQTLASSMEKGGYNTNLMFGVQWDLVMKYLEAKGVSQADLKTDSTNWGNYWTNSWNVTNKESKYSDDYGRSWTSGAYGKKDSEKVIALSTGACDAFCKQGIYDLAGNMAEFTLEQYSKNNEYPCVIRGNYFTSGGSGIYGSCTSRSGLSMNYNDSRMGFRVTLY